MGASSKCPRVLKLAKTWVQIYLNQFKSSQCAKNSLSPRTIVVQIGSCKLMGSLLQYGLGDAIARPRGTVCFPNGRLHGIGPSQKHIDGHIWPILCCEDLTRTKICFVIPSNKRFKLGPTLGRFIFCFPSKTAADGWCENSILPSIPSHPANAAKTQHILLAIQYPPQPSGGHSD